MDVQSFLNDRGLEHFITHDMDPEWDYRPYKKAYSPYFLSYGLKVPMAFAEYCGKMSGIESDLYLPRNLAFCYIYPYLAKYNFCPAYADKNIERRVLCIEKIKKETEVSTPQEIVYNMNGVFFNNHDEEINEHEAAQLLADYKKDVIIKPSVGSFGGASVNKIAYSEHSDINSSLNLFKKYQKDFQIQEVVKQLSQLASFNASSVNTVRIVTYRRPNKERKILFALIRFGSEGSIIDNICSGGGFCVLNLDGSLKDRIKHVYKTQVLSTIPNSCADAIPYWDKITKAALTLHGLLPYFDIVGWDFTINEEGLPILIEYNIRPGVGLQQGVGPMFSKEDLDEIMPNIMKFKSGFEIKPFVDFPNKKDFKSNWVN